MTSNEEPAASPWHDGEVALHRSVGVAERMEDVGRRVIRDHMIAQHRSFYAQLPYVVLGAIDQEGCPWATLRAGRTGFLQTPDPFHLKIETARDPGDPADEGLVDGEAVALLGMDLANRRRNRLNGTVRHRRDDGFVIEVEQSYGNCPKYIQERTIDGVRSASSGSASAPIVTDGLDDRSRALIARSDTVFVATSVTLRDGRRQADVSHRGGRAGFVRIGDDGVLTIPDFAGNLFFNTLGNIMANPRAGLAVLDFATGDLLQITGRAEVVLASDEIASFRGAERLWRLEPQTTVFRPAAMPLQFAFEDEGWSPNVLSTGTWTGTAERPL